jgi:hypothetical protein
MDIKAQLTAIQKAACQEGNRKTYVVIKAQKCQQDNRKFHQGIMAAIFKKCDGNLPAACCLDSA